jgi:ribonuclease E
MTRQRTRPSHKLLASSECPYCVGTGAIKTAETFEIDCMRSLKEALSGKSLSRLEVVVPQDLAISILNARHKELSELEAQHDCRIVFTGDSLIKAREFRLIPTARKGERHRDRDREGPIRPSLLAPLMVERAKAMALARELATMKPDQLERELEEGELKRRAEHAPEPEPAPAPVAAPAPRVAATIWDEAIVLRRLLFSPNTPFTVAPQAKERQELAPEGRPASMPARHSGGRRRRR